MTNGNFQWVDNLKNILKTQWFGKEIQHFESIDSTNNEIKRLALKNIVNGFVVLAEEQSAGRGRRGNNWISEKGSGIWMSFMIKPKIPVERVSMLTLVAALAVAKAVKEETGLDCNIKWPNDILVNKHKVCGILTELSMSDNEIAYVVVGIGINVNSENFPENIKNIASSLFLESKKKQNREQIIASFGKWFEYYYDQFLETEDLSLLTEEYNKALINAGKQVRIIGDKDEKEYRAVGIDKEGLLIVEDDKGNVEKIRAGEVSVRGIYGYV